MMISPEGFFEEYRNKTYTELLTVRDELFDQIRTFEKHTYDPKLAHLHASPEVVYQCNLEYLGQLCKLIAEKYNQEYIWGDSDEDFSGEGIKG